MNEKKKENPFLSLIFNILIPVVVLKNGVKWIQKYQVDDLVGPLVNDSQISSAVFAIALFFPFFYFFFDFFKRKNINFISILGFVNILLTGGIGIFGERYGLSRNWFIFKEGSLPLVIGSLLFLMRKYKMKSFHSFLLNDAVFDTEIIESAINREKQESYNAIINRTGNYLIAGFIISSIIQFILSSLIVVANPGEIGFNEQVSTMTWVSYFAVMVPTILIVGKGFISMIADLEKMTSLNKEEFLRN